MKIADLIPTQNELRSIESVNKILELIDIEGYNLAKLGKIVLINTEDGKYYVHNGHHRLVALRKFGIQDLYETWYEVWNMTYAQLASVNFEKGYVTPYDPRTECRLTNFYAYKQNVMDSYKNNGYFSALWFIVDNWFEYLEKRQITTIKELSETCKAT